METDKTPEEATHDCLRTIPGLQSRDVFPILQGMGSVANVAVATRDALRERTPLDDEKIDAVRCFFREDKLVV